MTDKETLNKLADEHGYSDKMGNVSGLFEHFELGYNAAQAEIAALKSSIKRYEEKDFSYGGLFYSSISTDMLCKMLASELKIQVLYSYGTAEKLGIVEAVKNQTAEIAELEAQNSKLVEALKIANDILGKNSIYSGDLAEFYKLLIELEIR